MVEQARPGPGLLVHQALRLDELARRAALDEVAGERERGTGEADERHRRVGPDEPDRLQQWPHRRLGLERLERQDVLEAPDRPLDDRAPALDDVERDAEAGEGRRDVREQDGRINAETAHRLERDLGAQGRVAGDLDERRVRADGPVFGQRAPGLAHEPDGRRVHWQAAGRAQEARLDACRRGLGQAKGGEGAHRANPRRAASSVSASSASPWAAEMNQDSNWDGGSSTPASSIVPKNRAYASRSEVSASAPSRGTPPGRTP